MLIESMQGRLKKGIIIIPTTFLVFWAALFFKYVYLGEDYYYASVREESPWLIGSINAVIPHTLPITPTFEALWVIPTVAVFFFWLAAALTKGLLRRTRAAVVLVLVGLNLTSLHSTLFPTNYALRVFFDSKNLAPLLWWATIGLDAFFLVMVTRSKRSDDVRTSSGR